MSQDKINLQFTTITANQSFERAYFKMFKFLFPTPKRNNKGEYDYKHLSPIEMKYKEAKFSTKLIYILVKNKHLELTNNGKDIPNNSGVYADDNGDIYVEYTTKDFMTLTGIKDPKTIRSAKKELKDLQLLEEVETKGKKPNRFYLLRPQISNRSLKYNVQDSNDLDVYYELPKYLYEFDYFNDLSISEKFAYAILVDRYLYSVTNENENFIDGDGNIYCVFTNETLAAVLGYKSVKQIPILKKALKKKNLMHEVKVTGESSRIYINTPKNLYDVKQEKTQNTTESKTEYKGGIISVVGGNYLRGRGGLSPWLGGDYLRGRGELSPSINTPYKYALKKDSKRNSISNHYSKKEFINNTEKEKVQSSSSDKNKELLILIEKEFNIKISNSYQKQLLTRFTQLNYEVIEFGIEYSSIYGNNPKQYLLVVLDNWIKDGVQTIAEAKSYKKSTKPLKAIQSKEMTPKWLQEKNSDISSEQQKHYDNVMSELKSKISKKFEYEINNNNRILNNMNNIFSKKYYDWSQEDLTLLNKNKNEFIETQIQIFKEMCDILNSFMK